VRVWDFVFRYSLCKCMHHKHRDGLSIMIDYKTLVRVCVCVCVCL